MQFFFSLPTDEVEYLSIYLPAPGGLYCSRLYPHTQDSNSITAHHCTFVSKVVRSKLELFTCGIHFNAAARPSVDIFLSSMCRVVCGFKVWYGVFDVRGNSSSAKQFKSRYCVAPEANKINWNRKIFHILCESQRKYCFWWKILRAAAIWLCLK